VSGANEIRQFLDRVYGANLRLKENGTRGPEGALTHSRIDVGPFIVDDVHLPGDVETSPDPLNRVVALWATEGRAESRCDGLKAEAAAGEITLLAQPDLPHRGRAQDLRVTSVLLDPSVVAGVAAGLPSAHAPLPIRFADFRPVDAPSSRLWKDTVNYVKNCVLVDDIMSTPLVLGHASRMMAAVLLSTFPSTTTSFERPHDRTDHRPVLLRRAIEYVDSNAANDIALADIAEAVHVTPRAVQYTFRRHLDTTPLHYLRQVRLHHARQELLAADRRNKTVTAIAARWGFMHTGRFAVMYRQTFGESPHETLRG
jgi:AraC-like DNA-binding protein